MRKKYEDPRPIVSVGTIGPAGQGKTTLTSAITKVLAEQGKTRFRTCDDLDKEDRGTCGPRSKDINYSTDTRKYVHLDLPGKSCTKDMILTTQFNCAILVISAKDEWPNTANEQLRIARQSGVRHIVVWISHCDITDSPALLDRMEVDVRDLLCENNFQRDETPVIRGSAKLALDGDAAEMENIARLIMTMDTYFPTQPRPIDLPFLHHIKNIAFIDGRGTVASGYVQRGQIKVGDSVEIVGSQETRIATVTAIEVYKKAFETANAYDSAELFFDSKFELGQVIAKPGSIKAYTRFKAELYVLSKEEAGLDRAVATGHRAQFCVSESEVEGRIRLPEGIETVLPGTYQALEVELQKPLALEEGMRFAMREDGRVISAGIVTAIVE